MGIQDTTPEQVEQWFREAVESVWPTMERISFESLASYEKHVVDKWSSSPETGIESVRTVRTAGGVKLLRGTVTISIRRHQGDQGAEFREQINTMIGHLKAEVPPKTATLGYKCHFQRSSEAASSTITCRISAIAFPPNE